MKAESTNPVVHLELQTDNLPRSCWFYARLFGWRFERIEAGSACYFSLELGGGLEGGGVECEIEHPIWLPYVAVGDIFESTERARELGGSVSLGPREGSAGWRSFIAAPGAEIALWQPKECSIDG
jgi:predicted enzyme related to lactoylglutathione lyase